MSGVLPHPEFSWAGAVSPQVWGRFSGCALHFEMDEAALMASELPLGSLFLCVEEQRVCSHVAPWSCLVKSDRSFLRVSFPFSSTGSFPVGTVPKSAAHLVLTEP